MPFHRHGCCDDLMVWFIRHGVTVGMLRCVVVLRRAALRVSPTAQMLGPFLNGVHRATFAGQLARSAAVTIVSPCRCRSIASTIAISRHVPSLDSHRHMLLRSLWSLCWMFVFRPSYRHRVGSLILSLCQFVTLHLHPLNCFHSSRRVCVSSV